MGHLTQSVAINYLPSPDNAQGTVTQNWQHDQRGRLITSRLNMGVTGGTLPFPTFPQYQQTQTYNDIDQPMMMQTTVGGSGGYTTSQAYDGTTGTLTGLSNNGVGTANLATLTYNGQGLIGGMSYLSTNGPGSPVATSTMSYDPNLRPTGSTTTWQSNGTTLFNDQITYDAIGNVLSRNATESPVTGQSGTGGSETQNFCYDEQNRLIWASNNAAVPSAGNGTCGNVGYQSTLGGNYTNQYAYTNLGQLWQGPKNGGSTQEQYLYCDSAHPHQLSNLSQTASTPTCASKGTVDYTGTYDSWGNINSQVRDGITRTLKYDGQDHLMRWSSSVNSQQEWNLYDASGERVLRRTYDGTTTVLTVFAFGVEEHAYSYSGSGSTDTNTGNTYYYNLGGLELGTWDGTSPASPTTNFLLTDTLGSVVSSFNNLPNGAAVVLGDQVYGPYGNKRVQQGTISTSKGFTGQFTDFVAGLDYYHARYYDPVVGVFVSADKKQGNMQGMNPYGYVGGNPETTTDPTGNICGVCTGQGYPTPAPPASGCGPCHAPTGYVAPPATGTGATIPQGSGVGSTASVAHASPPKPKQNLLQQFLSKIGSWFSTPPQYLKSARAGCYQVEALSFAPQTKVATSTGLHKIASLYPGEKVRAYNPKSHKMEWQPIEAVWINHDSDLVDLTMTFTLPIHVGKPVQKESELIHTNRKHPFLTVEKGFTPVANLHIGMHVVRADGDAGIVSAWKAVPGTQAMYNLTVAQDHTFTVGNGQWIVHNDDCMNAILSGGYDPAGLNSASLQEIRARLPANAVSRSFYPSNNIGDGYKWEWTDANGTKWMVEAHAPDANPAAAGGNASRGWIARVSRTVGSSKEYADAKGNWYRTSSFDPNSSDYTPDAINDTHIPIDDPGGLGGNYPSDFTDPLSIGDLFIP